MGDRVLGEPARATDQGSTETDTDLVLAARTDPERVYRRAITETPRHDGEVILS